MRLTQDFYGRGVVDVARDLLGKQLVFQANKGLITEVEAYGGPTPRSAIMFGPPGFSYVYFIYGMYHCLNVVCEEQGQGAAVLIRGVRLGDVYLDGPGKICRHLGITRDHNGLNMLTDQTLYITEGKPVSKILATPRIGISRAQDRLWRFVVEG